MIRNKKVGVLAGLIAPISLLFAPIWRIHDVTFVAIPTDPVVDAWAFGKWNETCFSAESAEPYCLVLVTHNPGRLDLHVTSEGGAPIKHSLVSGERREEGEFAYVLNDINWVKGNSKITVEAFQNEICILKVDLIKRAKLSRLNPIEHFISGF